MDKKGKYIVIEGGDGAGKDTQIALLQETFPDFVYTREPGGTPLGKELREMLLHGSKGAISLPAELFLFLADRAQHVEEVIKPALAEGKVVVSNRSWISFLAYQVYGREQLDWKPLIEQSLQKIFETCPLDLAVVLTVPLAVGRERQRAMGKIPDTMESMPDASHERIRQAFLTIASELPHARVIDASKTKEEVRSEVKAAIQAIL
jgi:dTMP kinase